MKKKIVKPIVKRTKSSDKPAQEVIDSEKLQKKHITYAKDSHRIFSAMAILILALASFVTSILLAPVIILFKSTQVYTIVLGAGLLFGFIFSFVMMDMRHLEKKHHLITSIVIPIIAVVNIFIMVMITKKIAAYFFLDIKHNPVIIAAYYLIGFILPYLFFGLLAHFKKKDAERQKQR